MTMIERVARAIAECQQELGADKWRYCLPEARAAIEAMRKPTARMLPDEGVHIGFFHDADGIEDNLYADKDEARDIWRAMIDAALSETEA